MTIEEVPAAIRAAFTSARSALKTNAEGVATLVSEKKYAAASLQLQALAGNTDLTEEQRNVVGGATIAVNKALQEIAATAPAAAEEGTVVPPSSAGAPQEDAAAAAAVLEHHIRTK